MKLTYYTITTKISRFQSFSAGSSKSGQQLIWWLYIHNSSKEYLPHGSGTLNHPTFWQHTSYPRSEETPPPQCHLCIHQHSRHHQPHACGPSSPANYLLEVTLKENRTILITNFLTNRTMPIFQYSEMVYTNINKATKSISHQKLCEPC